MAFPPKSFNKSTPKPPSHVTESGAISTGEGGLAKSKAIKNAAIVASPGIEKVNSAS